MSEFRAHLRVKLSGRFVEAIAQFRRASSGGVPGAGDHGLAFVGIHKTRRLQQAGLLLRQDRELGPLVTALLVLARVGTGNVVELGTARATGEVEALEALGIDPVHYLIVPRVVGMAIGTFALTVYLIIGALVSGYLWAFLQDVPLRPDQYFNQLASSLSWIDFALLALKTFAFGAIIAMVTCYHGLAQPLRLEEVSRATVRAVAQAVVACVLIDALFIVIYLTVS